MVCSSAALAVAGMFSGMLLSAAPARADFIRWVGSDGLWNVNTNWNPATVPGPNDPVLVDQGLYTATHDAASGNSIVAQVILENRMTVVLSGGTLSALGGDDPDQYFTSLGVFGTSHYSQTGGVLEAPLGIDVSGASRFDISAGEITGQSENTGMNIATGSSYTQTGGTNHLSFALGGGTASISGGQLGDTATSIVRVLFGGTLSQQGGIVTAQTVQLDTNGQYQISAGTINTSTISIGKLDDNGVALSSGTFAQSGGTIWIDNMLDVNAGQYQLSSDGVINSSAFIRIGTDIANVATDAVFDNAGTITFSDLATGIGGNGTFNHHGTLVKAGVNSGGVPITATFVTSGGTIDVQNGSVDVVGNLHALLPQIGADALVKTGPGILRLGGAQDWQAGTTLQLLGGETIAVSDLGAGAAHPDVHLSGATLTISSSQSLNSLKLDAGALARVMPGTASTLMVGTLQIDADNGATLDLADNAAMFASTDQIAVQSLIQRARNGGAWDSPGVTSSTAASETAPRVRTLAVITGTEFHALNGPDATFNLYAVGSSDVLVKYTYYGDTDLNGVVNFDDYARTDNGFNNNLSGWLNGDFDYNNVVNFDDYALIDLAFNSQAATLPRALAYLNGDDRSMHGMDDPSLQLVTLHFAEFGQEYAQQFLNSVPEPAAAFAGLLMLGAEIGRRQRQRPA